MALYAQLREWAQYLNPSLRDQMLTLVALAAGIDPDPSKEDCDAYLASMKDAEAGQWKVRKDVVLRVLISEKNAPRRLDALWSAALEKEMMTPQTFKGCFNSIYNSIYNFDKLPIDARIKLAQSLWFFLWNHPNLGHEFERAIARFSRDRSIHVQVTGIHLLSYLPSLSDDDRSLLNRCIDRKHPVIRGSAIGTICYRLVHGNAADRKFAADPAMVLRMKQIKSADPDEFARRNAAHLLKRLRTRKKK